MIIAPETPSIRLTELLAACEAAVPEFVWCRRAEDIYGCAHTPEIDAGFPPTTACLVAPQVPEGGTTVIVTLDDGLVSGPTLITPVADLRLTVATLLTVRIDILRTHADFAARVKDALRNPPNKKEDA